MAGGAACTTISCVPTTRPCTLPVATCLQMPAHKSWHPAAPTPGALSPDTLEALRGFSFERLQRLLLLAIRDVHKSNDRDDV